MRPRPRLLRSTTIRPATKPRNAYSSVGGPPSTASCRLPRWDRDSTDGESLAVGDDSFPGGLAFRITGAGDTRDWHGPSLSPFPTFCFVNFCVLRVRARGGGRKLAAGSRFLFQLSSREDDGLRGGAPCAPWALGSRPGLDRGRLDVGLPGPGWVVRGNDVRGCEICFLSEFLVNGVDDRDWR